MRVSDITKIAVCSAITVVFSQFTIPIGTVPITLQLLAVFISAMVLKPTQAFISQILYILLGLIGLPVFADATSGITVILGPTGGFLFTFPIIAFFVSLVISKYQMSKYKLIIIFASMLVSIIFCYVVGLFRFMQVTGLDLKTSIGYSVAPFIFPDIVKAAVASFGIYNRLEYIRDEI